MEDMKAYRSTELSVIQRSPSQGNCYKGEGSRDLWGQKIQPMPAWPTNAKQ